MNDKNKHIQGIAWLVVTLMVMTGCSTTSKVVDIAEPAPHGQQAANDDTGIQELNPLLAEPDPEHTPISAEDSATPEEIAGNEAVSAATQPESLPAVPAVWERLRAGFALPDRNHPRVLADKKWYARHQGYLNRTLERARPFLHYIMQEVERRGMPMELALLPMVESAFQPFAYSHGSAAGIWQFIQATGERYGLKINWWYDGRRDVHASTDAALNYLQDLAEQFDGDWLLALAAYNSGEGKVAREIQRNRRLGKATDYWSLSLPVETRGYVPKLLALTDIVADPARYGVTLLDVPDQPHIAAIEFDSQIDLPLIAELSEIPIEDLYRLNSGLNRWATDPDGPHRLLLPIEKMATVKEKVQALTPEQRVQWKRHIVKPGDTITSIAEHYATNPAVIRQVNRLANDGIYPGHTLIVAANRQTLIAGLNMEGTEPVATATVATPEPEKVEHRVKTGDTLWNIAKRYSVSIKNLLHWNAMALRDVLKKGQRLIIWLGPNSAAAEEVARPINAPVPEDVTHRVRYTVRKGDSLQRIAKRFNVDIDKVREWNKHLTKKKRLKPGQVLTLFVDVTQVTDKI